MTWTPETSRGYESAKIAAVSVPYLQGTFVDLGCGTDKVWPSAIGIDSGKAYGVASDIVADIADLSIFATGSMDAVFSSHALEDFDRSAVPRVLEEWARILRVGGNLVLYVPSANLYPRKGEPGANKAHKWDIYPGEIEEILKQVNWGDWTLLESEERSGTNEYSLFIVARKMAPGSGWRENVWQRNPGGKKRALVIRYGAAIGDMMIASSILPGLQRKGYHVTFNTTPTGRDLLLHDPHVDEWIIQDRDFVPNPQLGPYWEALGDRFDQVINLCESIEGTYLTIAGRIANRHSPEARRRLLSSANYLEITHDIADVPYEFASRFYPTDEERAWALDRRAEIAAPVIAWVLHGSAMHKASPHIQHVVSWLLQRSPCEVVLLGDRSIGSKLAAGIISKVGESAPGEIHRIRNMAGEQWTRRQALAFSQVADCVVGPETGILNAVALEMMPKVVYLSHSSRDNLTRTWVNTTALAPPSSAAPCYPCHMMHQDWSTCHQDPETGAALCAAGVTPMALFAAIATALGAVRCRDVAAE